MRWYSTVLGLTFSSSAIAFGVLAFGDELENLALPARQLFERAFPVGDAAQGKLLDAVGRRFPG